MSFLSRFRILTKILAIIILMGGMAVGITFVGTVALKSLNVNADNMGAAARRSLVAARANQNVLAMSRAEFRSALDPRVENRSAARKVIEENVKQFEGRIEELEKSRDEKAREMLPAVKAAYAAYQKDMENTLRLVDGVKDTQLSETTVQLRDAAMKSRTAAEDLQAKIRSVADDLSDRVENLARESTVEYEAASRLMMMCSAAGIMLGLLFGFLIGQYGVAKPIRAIVELLQSLAAGHFDINVGGTERKDEIGDSPRPRWSSRKTDWPRSGWRRSRRRPSRGP